MAYTKKQTYDQLSDLLDNYKKFKMEGMTDNSSEETVRSWLNEFLNIFGWDVKNTKEVLQTKKLSEHEIKRLEEIESTHDIPDYLFKQGNVTLTYIDAKDFNVHLKENKKDAFQIRSYGWSSEVPCAFLTNFEEISIYDCRYTPNSKDEASQARAHYFTIDEYLSKFDVLYAHLHRDSVISGQLRILYSDTTKISGSETLNHIFSSQLSNFRLKLAQHILDKNSSIIEEDSTKLSYVVQVILDRVVFIRVCEARYLENEGLLRTFLDDGFWKKFKESSYTEFYEHYDGPLFEKVEILKELDIEDTVFSDFIMSLYYPSPYRFDVIPIKLLADVYEQFLVKRLRIYDGKVEEEFKLEYQKTHAAISTPKYLVDYICKTTTDGFNFANSFDELIRPKILDPACGSGTFLISTFELLESRALELAKNETGSKIKNMFHKEGDEFFLTIEGKRTIVKNCIFGIDVDSEAVEVAKMSLALKVIDNNGQLTIYENIGLLGSKILAGIGENIELGNTLVEGDIYVSEPDLMEDTEQLLLIRPYDITEGKFSKVFELNCGFDYIVGNPPYVETKHYKGEAPIMHHYIRDHYSTYSGKADLSVIFMERCKKLLCKSGTMGLLVQKRFFGTEYGSKIRKFL